MPHILLIGGHGKVSLLMTPKLLFRSWEVTSLIRTQEQEPAILEAGKNKPGKLNVLVAPLQDVKSEPDAKKILEKVRPDWVVWSAGAGGKGGPSMTEAIDRDACIHFIRASISTPSIHKFLIVSALSSRRNRALWWGEEAWALIQRMNTEVMPAYFKAKLAADEALTVLGEERMAKDKNFTYLSLRPGRLEDQEETGKVQLGKTEARGSVMRGDVAEVAVRLLETAGAKGWVDLLGGEAEIGAEVQRFVKEGVNSMEGEDLGVMKAMLV